MIRRRRRGHADLERARLQLVHLVADATRHPPERLELRVEPREELVRARGRGATEQLPKLDIRRAELFERTPKLRCALARRRPVPPHAELAQHTEKCAATGYTPDVDGTLEPFRARAHQAAYLRRLSPGNAKASRAAARGSGRPLHGERARRVRPERRRAARRESGVGLFRDERRAGRRHRER